MADHWNQPATAAAGQQQDDLRRIQSIWDSLELQLSLFSQVIALGPGVYESWSPVMRDFFKLKMEARYSCEALYLSDSGSHGRVFLAPSIALSTERMSICAPRHQGELPVFVAHGGAVQASGAGTQQTAQKQSLDPETVQQMIQQSVQQAVQQMPESANGSTGYRGEDDDGHSDGGFVDTGSKYRKKAYASGGPRPANSFMLYRKHVHAEVTAQNPGVKNAQISQIIGLQWRNLPEEEKDVWRACQEEAAAQHSIMYPNYKYTPKQKCEKENDTPSKGKGPSKKQQDHATSQSSYELPPSPSWNKTSFGDVEPEPINPILDQMASTGSSETFFDQAMAAEAPVGHPASTGTSNSIGEAAEGTNQDLANVAYDDSANVAAYNVAIYNEPATYGAGYDGFSNEYFEMGDWDFSVDIDAAMRDFDFSLSM
ncbi:hypothetical protein PG994_004747 [Apiospora phragmitis]|uniref:HMG box domain-containing protein n=1 Tax=Apiospora phragmitis TaxID=2905665 RepID=A0ABR1VVG5_9PEZI